MDDVETEEFFYNICSDPFLERQLNTWVRETTDGDRETLDNLLVRAEKEHNNERITLEEFFIFFTRRGKLRPGEKVWFDDLGIDDLDTARMES